ncbi:MAG TPA: hypothetical protein V6D17_21020 [Candidatus Obscuribacterales bacterium]
MNLRDQLMIKKTPSRNRAFALRPLAVSIAIALCFSLSLAPSACAAGVSQSALIVAAKEAKPKPKAGSEKSPGEAEKAKDKDKEKEKAEAPEPEPVITNVVDVSPMTLVDKPDEYLNKNVKFSAKFSSFANLALDYKPALRESKKFLSFLVLQPDSHIPLSRLKLAMPIPKESNKEKNQLLQGLKDGDEVEVIGKVFSTALGDPWVDVLKLTKTASAPDDKKEKVSAHDEKK